MHKNNPLTDMSDAVWCCSILACAAFGMLLMACMDFIFNW